MSQHVLAENANRARGRRENTEQHRKRRRFARAITPQQGSGRAAMNVKTDATHGIHVLEGFAQLANFDDGGSMGGER